MSNEEKREELARQFSIEFPDADYTFGHIVIADYNVHDSDLHYCYTLDNVKMWLQQELDEAKSGYALMDRIALYAKVHEFLASIIKEATS